MIDFLVGVLIFGVLTDAEVCRRPQQMTIRLSADLRALQRNNST
jgi:hypothetical protein